MTTLTQDHFKCFFNVFFSTHLHGFFFFKTRPCHCFHTIGAFSPSPCPGPWSILQIDSTTVSPSLFVGLRPLDTRTQKTVPFDRATPGVGGYRCARLSHCTDSVFFRRGTGTFPWGVSFTHRLRDGCACSRGRHSGPWSHWK